MAARLRPAGPEAHPVPRRNRCCAASARREACRGCTRWSTCATPSRWPSPPRSRSSTPPGRLAARGAVRGRRRGLHDVRRGHRDRARRGGATGRAHARRWTNRQSGLSAVLAIVAEALHLQAASDVRELTATLAAELGAVWSVTPSAALLTPNQPRFTFGSAAQLRQCRERQRPAASQPGVLGLLCRLRWPARPR